MEIKIEIYINLTSETDPKSALLRLLEVVRLALKRREMIR